MVFFHNDEGKIKTNADEIIENEIEIETIMKKIEKITHETNLSPDPATLKKKHEEIKALCEQAIPLLQTIEKKTKEQHDILKKLLGE